MNNVGVSTPAVAIPGCVLIDFFEHAGQAPAARWGHTSVVIDDKVIIYGGEGDQIYGDLHMFEPGEAPLYAVA